jgi:hypothetical protein
MGSQWLACLSEFRFLSSNPSTNATRNVLAEIEGPIDALACEWLDTAHNGSPRGAVAPYRRFG